MISISKQRGATFVFWVFFAALIGFLLMLGIKLFPVYYKGFATEKIIEDLALEMGGKKPSKKQLWQSIERRLDINSLSGVSREHFVYSRDKDAVEFGLDYEVRVPIIHNLDAVAKFDQRQTIIVKN